VLGRTGFVGVAASTSVAVSARAEQQTAAAAFAFQSEEEGAPSSSAASASSASAAAVSVPAADWSVGGRSGAVAGGELPSVSAGGGGGEEEEEERVGVLLLNLGGPDRLDDVKPFLYNLFADPDIIRLPGALRALQPLIAWLISTSRAPKSIEAYKSIGGGSPLRRVTMEQGQALAEALAAKGCPARVYVGMRYWNPFTEEAVEALKADRINRLVVLPLYPQFSISTSGSSLRLLEEIFAADAFLSQLPHTVIPSWYQRPGYVTATADLIEAELAKFADSSDVHIFFSAHGVPVSYVEEAGDPYKAEMEECIQLIMEELQARGTGNDYTLAYQSRVGPVEWLKPYTDDTIRELGASGVKKLLAVPISFVSEHIETLEEIDMEYRELAEESGISEWGRVPTLGTNTTFIRDLADAVVEATPFAGAIKAPAAAATPPPSALVPIGSVEDLLAAYDRERFVLPPPVEIWKWGWTRSAETWNGRLAMIAVSGLLLCEVTTGNTLLTVLGSTFFPPPSP